MPAEAFLPSRHGFAFANEFEVPSSPFGFGAPVSGSFGLCAGIAWAALDRFLAGRRIETASEPPAPGNPLYAELLRRHANALGSAGVARLTRWQQLPDEGRPGAPGLRERSRREWRRLRRRLDAGEPVLVVLILAAGPYANPTTNHMVLVYGYDLDRRAGRVALRVYDPNRPRNDGVRLVFRLGDRRTPLEARLAVDARVRGFYVVAYDRPRPAPLAVSGVSASHDGTLPFAAVTPPALAFARGALHLFGQDATGHAMHASRGGRGEWSGGRIVTGRAGDGFAVAAPPLPLAGRAWCIAMAPEGGLFELRKRPLLGWRQRAITTRRGSASLRADSPPAVAGRERRAASRFYVIANGRLAASRYGWRGWSVEWPEGSGLVGTPAVVESRQAEHVFARTEGGELIHFRRGRGGDWTKEHVTIALGGRDRFGIAEDPVALTAAGSLGVAARNRAGDVLLFRWSSGRGWRCRNLSADLRSSGESVPAASEGISATADAGGTVHIAGRCPHGGVLHFWSRDDGEAGIDEVVTTRAAIGDTFRVDGVPRIFPASGGWLHIVARRKGELLLFRWAPGADWTVETVGQLDPGERLGAGSEPTWLVSYGCCHLAHAAAGGGVRYIRIGTPQAVGLAAAAVRVAELASEAAVAAALLPVQVGGAVLDGVRALLGGAGASNEPAQSPVSRGGAAGERRKPSSSQRPGESPRTLRGETASGITPSRARAAPAMTSLPELPEPPQSPALPELMQCVEPEPPQPAALPELMQWIEPASSALPELMPEVAPITSELPELQRQTEPERVALPELPPEHDTGGPIDLSSFDQLSTSEAWPVEAAAEEDAAASGDSVVPEEDVRFGQLDLTPVPEQAAAAMAADAEDVQVTDEAGAWPELQDTLAPTVTSAPADASDAVDRPPISPVRERSAALRLVSGDGDPPRPPLEPAAANASGAAANGQAAAANEVGSGVVERSLVLGGSRRSKPAARAKAKPATSPAERRKLNPALEGLPFLDDSDDAPPAAATPKTGIPPDTAVPPAERRKRDVEAMKRIMSLAEEYSTRSGPSTRP